MPIRGIRGATTANGNTRDDILDATCELLETLVKMNGVCVEDIASVIFTMTPDLDAAFPASAARALGWTHVPLLDVSAPRVSKDLGRCIRVLIHWNTDRAQKDISHAYLRDARNLRPDLAKDQLP
jgi:chorismate mutase